MPNPLNRDTIAEQIVYYQTEQQRLQNHPVPDSHRTQALKQVIDGLQALLDRWPDDEQQAALDTAAETGNLPTRPGERLDVNTLNR